MARLGSLLIVTVLVPNVVVSFLWSRSSSSSTSQLSNHFSTNNCMCLNQLLSMLSGLGNGGSLGRREAAAILNLDERDPDMAEFMDHVDTNDDGKVDREVFKAAIRRTASHNSQSNSPNVCHCGRMVVDQLRRDL